MKIHKETVDKVREAIAPLDIEPIREVYRSGNYPRADRTKDVDKRYRWDLLHACGIPAWSFYDQEGVNDTHIDTMLRSIVAPLGE